MRYTGENLREINFPLGGIGTGSIGLCGNGAFMDWEIFNRPNKGSYNDFTHIALRAQWPDGKSVTKVLQGDWIKDLMGKYTKVWFQGYGYGPARPTMSSFAHFRHVTFDGRFPIATLTFEDECFPAQVVLTAFNPFIPLDSENSSIPAAFFDICIKNREEGVRYTVVFSVCNPFDSCVNTPFENDRYTGVTLRHHGVPTDDIRYGDLTVAIDTPKALVQAYWYRGSWHDNITTFWREMESGQLHPRTYDTPGFRDVCSVGDTRLIEKEDHFRFVLSWNVPNQYNDWTPRKDEQGNFITWKNYYATRYADSAASCRYALDHWDELYDKTLRFTHSLHTSTLDKTVKNAISSTLSVLKTATVLRLEDGTFYGWEGTHELTGSCEGTCTHVWSYAYALCFLFPDLEQSLRNTEFNYDTTEHGEMHFRTGLPLGYPGPIHPPCVDGQMATVIKIYRDWKLTGNTQWLQNNWHNVKKVLEYAWSEHNIWEWDRNKDGVLEGRQHHTLDMELFGPSSWLQSMYLAALKAAAEMADFFGETDTAAEYRTLFDKGYHYTRDHLFNGEYFFHEVDLKNKAVTEHFNCPDYWNEEKQQLKYQIAGGCEIDQMLGQWHASISGLGDIFDPQQRKTALQSMLKYNVKPSLRHFTNMWRVYALNDEGGTIMCDFPEGKEKPIIPVPYCEECMTGFEYAFAGLLISEGFIQEGLQVVRYIRDRYDGIKRNPWNEIECGNNYARPMASFALMPIFSGFTFDLPHRKIGFKPLLPGRFKCMWNLGSGWGDFIRTEKSIRITVEDGFLDVDRIELEEAPRVLAVYADGRKIPFTQDGQAILLSNAKVQKGLTFKLS